MRRVPTEVGVRRDSMKFHTASVDDGERASVLSSHERSPELSLPHYS